MNDCASLALLGCCCTGSSGCLEGRGGDETRAGYDGSRSSGRREHLGWSVVHSSWVQTGVSGGNEDEEGNARNPEAAGALDF
jgi:hypothetical protein